MSFGKILLSLFFVLSSVATARGQQNPQFIFDKANAELTARNYSKAIELYKQIEEQNMVSGPLFLNLGISYQRIDSLGKAKYYFLKAARFDATENRALRALEFVENQFSQQSAVLPKLPWDIATNWLQQNIGSRTLLAVSIFLLNIGILVYISHWFISAFAKYLNIGGLTLTVLSILLMALSFYTQYVSNRYSSAVMVTQKAGVYEQPKNNASLISQAFEGYSFTVDHYKSSEHPGWKYVRMSNGLYGWIPAEEIMIL